MARKSIDRSSIRYRLLKIYVIICHRLYYRKFQTKFRDRIPKDRPVLLAPNHQNPLMDAMAPLLTCRRDPVFLARADVFRKKFIAGILRLLKILPVYRIRDGVGELSKNEEVFQESMEVLLRKKCPVCIMPEGNHGSRRRLRPLVKGIFRVAFQVQENFGLDPGVVIVPVGIDYSNYYAFRGHLFVQYGNPVEVSEYYGQYRENQARAMNTLRERLAEEMKKYMIHIESDEHYDTCMLLRKAYNKRMRERLGISKSDQYHRLLADQHMIRELASAEETHPEEMTSLTRIGREYQEGLDQLGMRDWVFGRRRYALPLILLAGLGLLASLPLFIYGFIFNFPLYRLIGNLSKKMKDPQFYSSIKFVLGTFLFPILYLILFIPVWIFTDPGWIKWAFLASLPLSGLFAHTWYLWFIKFRSLWRYQFLNMSGDKSLENLKNLRKQIVEAAERLIPHPA